MGRNDLPSTAALTGSVRQEDQGAGPGPWPRGRHRHGLLALVAIVSTARAALVSSVIAQQTATATERGRLPGVISRPSDSLTPTSSLSVSVASTPWNASPATQCGITPPLSPSWPPSAVSTPTVRRPHRPGLEAPTRPMTGPRPARLPARYSECSHGHRPPQERARCDPLDLRHANMTGIYERCCCGSKRTSKLRHVNAKTQFGLPPSSSP